MEKDNIEKYKHLINTEIRASLTKKRPQLKWTAKRIQIHFPTTYPVILKKYENEEDRKYFLSLHFSVHDVLLKLDTNKLWIILDLVPLECLSRAKTIGIRWLLESITQVLHPEFSVEIYHSIIGDDFLLDYSFEEHSIYFRFSWETLIRLYTILWDDITNHIELNDLRYLEGKIARDAFEIWLKFAKTKKEYKEILNTLTDTRRQWDEYGEQIKRFLSTSKNYEDYSNKIDLLKDDTHGTLKISQHTKNNAAMYNILSTSQNISTRILDDLASRNKRVVDLFHDKCTQTELADLLWISPELYFFITSRIHFKSVEEMLSIEWIDFNDDETAPWCIAFCDSIEIPKKNTIEEYMANMKILGRYQHLSDYPELFSECVSLKEVIAKIENWEHTYQYFFSLSKSKKDILLRLQDHNYWRDLYYSNEPAWMVFDSCSSQSLKTLLRLTNTDHIKWLERLLSIPWILDLLYHSSYPAQLEALHQKYSYNVFLKLLWSSVVQRAARNLHPTIFKVILKKCIKWTDLIKFLENHQHLLELDTDDRYLVDTDDDTIFDLVRHKDIFSLLRDRNNWRFYDSLVSHCEDWKWWLMSFTDAVDKVIKEKIDGQEYEKTDKAVRQRNIFRVNIQQVASCVKHNEAIEWDETTRTLVMYYREENMDSWQYLTLLRTAYHYIRGWYSRVFNKIAFVSRRQWRPLMLEEMCPWIEIHDVARADFQRLCNHFANTIHLTHSSAIEAEYMQESTHIIGIRNKLDWWRRRVPENWNYVLMPVYFTNTKKSNLANALDEYESSYNISEISHLFWDTLIECEEKMLDRLYV